MALLLSSEGAFLRSPISLKVERLPLFGAFKKTMLSCRAQLSDKWTKATVGAL